MNKYHGLARVSICAKPFPGVPTGTVPPLGYHPFTFDPGDGRGKHDWHRRVRAKYAEQKGR